MENNAAPYASERKEGKCYKVAEALTRLTDFSLHGVSRRITYRQAAKMRAAASRLYLPSADVTVIRRLYIVVRHWS